jgi:hypothetical protein
VARHRAHGARGRAQVELHDAPPARSTPRSPRRCATSSPTGRWTRRRRRPSPSASAARPASKTQRRARPAAAGSPRSPDTWGRPSCWAPWRCS